MWQPTQRAPAEPAIQYYYEGTAADVDRYLSRNATTGLIVARDDTILVHDPFRD